MRFAFVRSPVKFILGGLTIAWGIGFLRYLGAQSWVFPVWPNILDVGGLCVVGLYLVGDSLKRRERLEKQETH
jgi:hypothetical protein